MSFQIQVADEQSLHYIQEDKGEYYTSYLIQKLIALGGHFEAIGETESNNLYVLREHNLYYFILTLEQEKEVQEVVNKEKNMVTVSYEEIVKLHKYLSNILNDEYFYWKSFVILAVVEKDVKEDLL